MRPPETTSIGRTAWYTSSETRATWPTTISVTPLKALIAAPRLARADTQGQIHKGKTPRTKSLNSYLLPCSGEPEQPAAQRRGHGAAVPVWVAGFFRGPARRDVLQRSGAPDRHVFTIVSMRGAPWLVDSYLTGSLITRPN